MFRKTAAIALVSALALSATAYAAKDSLSDPKGDYPDIVKLNYNNADEKVVMKLSYNGQAAQNESFYMHWGDDESYQVFASPSADIQELRYHGKGKAVKCDGLKVKRPSNDVTKAIVPRDCLNKAPDKLRFQGIATEGLYSVDETKISKAIKRG
jgi:hypothetical protein